MDPYEKCGGLGNGDEYDDSESGYGGYGDGFGGGEFPGALGGEEYDEEDYGSYGGAGFAGRLQ
jgi:hypothetical protein